MTEPKQHAQVARGARVSEPSTFVSSVARAGGLSTEARTGSSLSQRKDPMTTGICKGFSLPRFRILGIRNGRLCHPRGLLGLKFREAK